MNVSEQLQFYALKLNRRPGLVSYHNIRIPGSDWLHSQDSHVRPEITLHSVFMKTSPSSPYNIKRNSDNNKHFICRHTALQKYVIIAGQKYINYSGTIILFHINK